MTMKPLERCRSTVLTAGACLAISTSAWAVPCVLPDNGNGTVDVPPAGCDYVGNDQYHIIDGLPAATTIDIDVTFTGYFGIVSGPGGGLGGEAQTFNLEVQLAMSGTGVLAGFNRDIFLSASAETHTAAGSPGNAVQIFATDWFDLDGELFGDPDFTSLRLRTGNAVGLSSPGQTTLTRVGPPGSNFEVDSFFDITYQIDFVGEPGSVLEGFAGTTIAGVTAGADPVRMQAGDPSSLAEVDHYQCYKAKDLKNPKFVTVPGVLLTDQFGATTAEVKKPFLVCPPADKNGSGINNAVAHLCCYKIKAPKLDPAVGVEVTDQFGNVQHSLKKRSVLCQPCAKALLP